MNYDSIEAVNWSTLKALGRSPLHYRHRMDTEQEDARHLRLGRAVHTQILEPERFLDRHPIYPGAARRGKAWDEFQEQHAEADILLHSEAVQAQDMAASVLGHPLARKHLRDGISEKVLEWTDRETGLACKGRCDSVNGHLVELKSTAPRSFTPDLFAGQAIRLGYHGQMAFYADGLVATGYEVDHEPAMIVVESEPPHDVAVYVVSDEMMRMGRKLYKRLLFRLKDCIDSDQWPGVCAGQELELLPPAWAMTEPEDDQSITFGGKNLGW